MTDARLGEVLRCLEARQGRVVSNGRELSCQCPFHDDQHNSFSINRATGMFQCHVPGCVAHGKHGLSLDALAERLGLQPASKPRRKTTQRASAPPALPEPTAIYTYHDETGREVQQVLRYHTPTGKTFRQRYRGADGEWVWRAAERQVPYRLPELLEALQQPDTFVFIVEGEKDVETLRAHGIVATCNAMGAGKWRPEHAQFFKGAKARVAIIPDNDPPGIAHAEAVAESLRRYGVIAPIVYLPVSEKGDVSDWFAQGARPEQLIALAQQAHEALSRTPRLRSVERGVLARYMVTPSTFDEYPTAADWFFSPEHRLLHSAIADCWLSGETPTPVNVAARLHRADGLERFKGVAGLQALCDEATPVEDMRTRVAQIRDAAAQRRIAALARQIETIAQQDARDADERYQAVMRAVERALDSRAQHGGLVPLDALLSGFMSEVERLAAGQARRFVTGLAAFDDLVCIEPHRLYIFAGRPGMGKTAWLIYLAQALARKGAKVAFYSLEMNQFQVLRRMAAAQSRVPLMRIGASDMTETEWQAFVSALSDLSKRGLWLSESPIVDVATIRRQCNTIRERGGLDVVIVDYIGLLHSERAENETQRLSNIARDLKLLAGEMDCAVIVAAQLNRGVEERVDKRPLLADLRASGTLEEHADVVVMLYRDGYYHAESDPHALELLVRKQRDGRLGTIRLRADLARASFTEYVEPPRALKG